MPDRIPLAPGPSTPQFVEEMLSVFGKNPHKEPIFRLIWSERKQIYFVGEVIPEYNYLPCPGWVLETWLSPDKDAGSRASWGFIEEMTMGPYPHWGTYNFVKQYPSDWYPTEESVRLVCVGILESRNLSMAMREQAIREGLEAKEREGIMERAEAIVESYDSAAKGKIQAPVSGQKNNFRTPEDFERDSDRAAWSEIKSGLPNKGGGIYRTEN